MENLANNSSGVLVKESVLIDFVVKELFDEEKIKKVKKIVLTGGPCGGKSETLEPAKKALENEGYKVVKVYETATELIKEGLIPGEDEGNVPLYEFQKDIFILQLLKEITALVKATCLLSITDRVSVLCDRATPDGSIYIDRPKFDSILRSFGTYTLEELKGMYDLFIHFVSVAYDKPEIFKEIFREKGRLEDDIKEATRVEERTQALYQGLDNRIVLGNDCTFEEKQKAAIDSIIRFTRQDMKYIIVREKDIAALRKLRKEKTTDDNGQKRVIIHDHAHTYILGAYQDGSKMLTLEMMKGAPVPSWVIRYDEIKRDNRIKEKAQYQ